MLSIGHCSPFFELPRATPTLSAQSSRENFRSSGGGARARRGPGRLASARRGREQELDRLFFSKQSKFFFSATLESLAVILP